MRFIKECLLGVMLVLITMSTVAQAAVKPNAYDIYGHGYNFANDKGKWIIINYWADWCGACIEEIPELNKLAAAVKNKPVVFFGINYDGLPAKAQKTFADQHQVNFLLLRNNPFAEAIHKEEITSLPVTYIISPTGHVQELNGEQKLEDILAIIG
jgi:thiol-disulfide isomerase/thioredoxin